MKLKKLCLICTSIMLAAATPVMALADERPATQAELDAVKADGKSDTQWEMREETWRLLFLAPGATDWKYATGWVRFTKDNEAKYYFMDERGDMVETWTYQDGKWFFGVRDNYWRNKEDAGKIVTGWAKIPDENDEYHVFYFGAADNGRPTGMYEDTKAVIDGVEYEFNEKGYCLNPPKGTDIPKYSLKRTV